MKSFVQPSGQAAMLVLRGRKRLRGWLLLVLLSGCEPTIWCDYDGDGVCPPADCDDYQSSASPCGSGPEDSPTPCPFQFYQDQDGDRYGGSVTSCQSGEGWVSWGGDCDDSDPGVHPYYLDQDGDGYGDLSTCRGPGEGYVSSWGDCDDTNPDVHPGAPEWTEEECNDGIDNNCDGYADGLSVMAGQAAQAITPGWARSGLSAETGIQRISGGTSMSVLPLFSRFSITSVALLSPLVLALDDSGCPIPEEQPPSGDVWVLFMVDANKGQLDDNCKEISWVWPSEDPGDAPFIAGALHPDSPIQDPEYSAKLGNWVPNTVPLYDDGTHGDVEPGDGIWTLQLSFPPGARLSYKYTWGKPGELWTATEEWPGNMRLLEVWDNSGDGKVIRFDEFADETTNKDKANCYGSQGCAKTITWDTDQNGDGLPDAQERKVDVDNDCELDVWPEGAF